MPALLFGPKIKKAQSPKVEPARVFEVKAWRVKRSGNRHALTEKTRAENKKSQVDKTKSPTPDSEEVRLFV